MKRWIKYALVLWLIVAGAIAGVATVYAYDVRPGPFHQIIPTPEAKIDGEPAYIIHEYERARVERSGNPAWLRRSVLMIPVSQISGAKDDPSKYWRGVSIDKPFHLTFRTPDGTLTTPKKVDFGEPLVAGVSSGWSPDGSRFTFVSGYRGMPTNSDMLEGRMWNSKVVKQFALEIAMWIGILFVVIAMTTIVPWTREFARLRRMAFKCPRCGYDLRGATEPGCPECGAGRHAPPEALPASEVGGDDADP